MQQACTLLTHQHTKTRKEANHTLHSNLHQQTQAYQINERREEKQREVHLLCLYDTSAISIIGSPK